MANGWQMRAANGLALGAAPTFLLMALLTTLHEDAGKALHGAAGGSSPPLFGMGPMYLLMAAFHAHHWLSGVHPERRASRDRAGESSRHS